MITLQTLLNSLNHFIKNNKKILFGGGILITLSLTANVLNFLFNAFLGRSLSLSDYALISLMGGLLSFTQTLTSPFNAAINYKTGYLIGEYGEKSAFSFLAAIRRKALLFSILVTCIWLASMHLILQFFPSGTPLLIISFSIILMVGLNEGANRGFLSSQLFFASVAYVNLIDPIIRIIIAIILVHLHQDDLTYLALPIGILGSFLLGMFLVNRQKIQENRIPKKEIISFPLKYYSATLLTGLSSVVFLSVDILLANHYLNAHDAGSYGLLTLIGKMIYFLAALVTPFTIPLLSRSEGAKKNSRIALYALLGGNVLAAGSGFVLFGIFGFWTLPLLYGEKVLAVLPFVIFFSFGMVCFTLSKVLVNYYLIKKVYSATFVTVILAIFQIILISYFHDSVKTIALDMTIVWVLTCISMLLLHIVSERMIRIETFIKTLCKQMLAKKQHKSIQVISPQETIQITVAIPVLNEGENIKHMLSGILSQKEQGYQIKEILVISDGSTDNTISEIQKITDDRIRIIGHAERRGKAQRLNEIFAIASCEYIVLLDADVIMESMTLARLLEPFSQAQSIGIVSGKAVPFNGKTFLENSVNVSIAAYHAMVDKIRNGNNLFAIEGRVLAIKKSLGMAIPLPEKSIATDAFLYFSALKQGYSFHYVPQAVVYFFSPRTLKEHIQQNKRFVARKYTLKKYFGKIVDKELVIPRSIYLQIMFTYFCFYPIHSMAIFFINAYSKYLAKQEAASISGIWPLALSTKKSVDADTLDQIKISKK